MGVPLGRLTLLVPQKLLNVAERHPVLRQPRRRRVPAIAGVVHRDRVHLPVHRLVAVLLAIFAFAARIAFPVVRRHVAPGQAVPLHPEAVAFAGHYDFDIDVLAAYRPTGKGRVERQVMIVRDHVLAGRGFSSLTDMGAAFMVWVPMRRARTQRTHGEVRDPRRP